MVVLVVLESLGCVGVDPLDLLFLLRRRLPLRSQPRVACLRLRRAWDISFGRDVLVAWDFRRALPMLESLRLCARPASALVCAVGAVQFLCLPRRRDLGRRVARAGY